MKAHRILAALSLTLLAGLTVVAPDAASADIPLSRVRGATWLHQVPPPDEDADAGGSVVPLDSTGSAEPGTLEVGTVPSVENVVFTFDGARYVTGVDGKVRIRTHEVSNLQSRLKYEGVTNVPGVEVEFVRFTRLAEANGARRAVAVFDVKHAVRFNFTDLDGKFVPTSRITTLKIKSSTGREVSLSGADLDRPVSLPAIRVAPVPEGLEPKEIYYTAQEVIIDGTNTVNRSQQKVFPSRERDLAIETQFFNVGVAVKDAFFGFTNGEAVLVRRPDGSETRHAVVDGQVDLPLLPRGDYKMRVDGVGLAVWRPISVSRDQHIDLQLFSAVDISAAVLGLLSIIITFLVIGFRRARTLAKDRSPDPTPLARSERRSEPADNETSESAASPDASGVLVRAGDTSSRNGPRVGSGL